MLDDIGWQPQNKLEHVEYQYDQGCVLTRVCLFPQMQGWLLMCSEVGGEIFNNSSG